MAFVFSRHVQVNGIQDATIRYKWDDWDVESVDMPLDEGQQQLLGRLSQRAICAFTTGTAEWILYRFARLSDDPFPLQCLETAWTQIVNFNYAPHKDIRIEDWTGPVRGPVGVAIRRVKFAIQQADVCGDPAWRTGRIVKLAEHVLPDPAPYKQWRDRILARLLALYPMDADEKLGEVVPREALDPDLAFDISQTENLINRFLAGLDYRMNPCLNSPDQMRQQGFQGVPYVFSIEQDRKQRFDW